MDKYLLMLFSQLMGNRSTFDKLRPGTNNGYNLHDTAGFSVFLIIMTANQGQKYLKNIVVNGIYNDKRRICPGFVDPIPDTSRGL